MSEKFSLLLSMVPSLFKAFKPSKEKIISGMVSYIKYLEEEMERLEGLKKYHWKEAKVAKPALLKCTNQDSSVKVRTSNGATFFAIQVPFRCGSVAEIVKGIEKYQAEVLEARVCVNDQWLLTFTATIALGSGGGGAIDKIREEILTL